MTLLIAMHHGTFVTIAVDQRLVVKDGPSYRAIADDRIKVFEAANGILSGSGLSQLLDRVGSDLQVATIESTEEVLSIIHRARADFRDELPLGVTEADLAITGWVYTYFTLVDNAPTPRLLRFHPSTGDRFLEVPSHTSVIFGPLDMNDVVREGLQPIVAKLALMDFSRCSDSEIGPMIADALVGIFALASKTCDSVSCNFNLAFLGLGCQPQISHPIFEEGQELHFYSPMRMG